MRLRGEAFIGDCISDVDLIRTETSRDAAAQDYIFSKDAGLADFTRNFKLVFVAVPIGAVIDVTGGKIADASVNAEGFALIGGRCAIGIEAAGDEQAAG